jgi:8-oxo-dGTP diphosphatase
MIRRFGGSPAKGQRYRLRHGAYAVLMDGRDVLLTYQAEPEPEFQLPGGGIDPGESPLRALRREVYEETGWSIGAPLRLGAFRRFAYMPEYDLWAEKLCTIYLARPVRRLSEPTEAGHSALWMAGRDAAEVMANDGDRHFLLHALALTR